MKLFDELAYVMMNLKYKQHLLRRKLSLDLPFDDAKYSSSIREELINSLIKPLRTICLMKYVMRYSEINQSSSFI